MRKVVRIQSSINNDALLIKALYGYSMERDIVGKDYSQYLDLPSVGAKRPRDALNDFHVSRLAEGGSTVICDSRGKPVSAQRYREYFQQLMEKTGVPEATPHWCRHTFATRLHSAGADPLTAKWLLGHSTQSDITAHYTHETIGVLKDTIRLLS